MLELLSRFWWTLVLRGVLAVGFGLAALAWPGITLRVLVWLYGFYAVVDGLVALAALLVRGRLASGRRGWLIFEGVVGIAAGLAAFIWPAITALVLLYLIAAWLVVTGLLEVAAAVILRRELRGEWLLALAGILSVAFGAFLALRPGEGAITLVTTIGLFAIVFGVALLVLGGRLRQLRRRIDRTARA
jgi:uncharacterized membrane protein HdeD (DUF308 family)